MLNALGTILILIIAIIWVRKEYEDDMQEEHGLIKEIVDLARPYFQYVMFWLFALWGGTSSYFMEMSSTGGKASFKSWFTRMVISGFSGFLMLLLGQSVGLPTALVGVSAGIGGYMGGSAILFVQKVILRRAQL